MARPSGTHNSHRGLPVPDGTFVFPYTIFQKLTPGKEYHPRTSNCYQNDPEKPNSVTTLHHRRRGDKNANHHGGAENIPVTDNGLFGRIWSGNSPRNSTPHLFRSYGTINKIVPDENAVKTMGTYDTAEPPTRIINQLEKGW